MAQPPVEVWPDNWPAVELFLKLLTQWRTGPGGIIGLDYNVALAFIARKNLENEAFDALFDDLRILEAAALETIEENKD